MASIQIVSCNVSDGPTIGVSNIAAFWTDPTWVRMWPGKTREYVATQAARRMAYRLLMDREHKRHLKAVDTETGEIVGYACWKLPADVAEGMWLEAQVLEVEKEVYAAAERDFNNADWEFDRALDILDPPMLDMKARRMQGKQYILLDHLAVPPQHRGRGIGTMLVTKGLCEAEKLGLDTCVLGMRAGLGVYKRAGFTLLEEVIQDASQFGGEKEYAAYFLEKAISKT